MGVACSQGNNEPLSCTKMSVSYAPTKLSVPPGFEHLLEGLTREVLREQPPNIISFAAQYFRRKLNERPGRLVLVNTFMCYSHRQMCCN